MKGGVAIARLPRVVTSDGYGTLIDGDTGVQKILASILQGKKMSVGISCGRV